MFTSIEKGIMMLMLSRVEQLLAAEGGFLLYNTAEGNRGIQRI